MRIMGLDVGSKTVGVAISDPLGFTAQGLEIIQIDEEKEQFGFERLTELVEQYKVDKFVLGLPKNMNNTSGPREDCPAFPNSGRVSGRASDDSGC